MTAAQTDVLTFLAGEREPARTSWVGDSIWGERAEYYNGSNPHTRTAGKVLNALKKLGFVREVRYAKRMSWEITDAGRRAVCQGGAS